MATALPPPKGVAFTFYMSLVSQADTDIMQTSVTLAAGDVTYFGDGSALGNVGTLPVEIGTTGVLACVMANSEMDYDCVVVRFHDVAGSEYQDHVVEIYTAAQTLDAIDANVDSILADTGTDGVVLANDAITLSKFDESTAFPLTASDVGATQVARVGADSDTLETLSDQIDLQATATALTTHDGKLVTAAANVVLALADTGELQADWADGGRLDLLIDTILADTASLNDTVLAEITAATDVPATPTARQALMLLYMMARNNSQATATERRVLNNAGTEILDATMSDDGTTFSAGQLGDA